jgi:hypothetical protein
VIPEIETVTVLELMRKIPNSGALVLRCTVKRFAPGPVMVRFLSITNSPLVRVTVVMLGETLTVSPEAALRIACRNEPGPLSSPFVAVTVAAGVSVALNNSTAIAQAALNLFFVFISFLRCSLEILKQRHQNDLDLASIKSCEYRKISK